MKAFQIELSGKWGHFRKPEANNNPITYDFIPKTAFIGLIGAIIGLTRSELRNIYSKLSNSIYYNVQILKPILKIATNFRIYKYKGSLNSSSVKNVPQFYEILQNPKYKITFYGNNSTIKSFTKNIETEKSIYTATFGLINCPVLIENFKEIKLTPQKNKALQTSGFIPYKCKFKIPNNTTLSYDKIPVIQNNNWFNTKYTKVYYGYLPSQKTIEVEKSNYKKQFKDKTGLSYYFV